LYEVRGTFQMRVTHLEEAGRGDLRRRFEQVRARLEAEGLLEEARKRRLPHMPRHVGVVTSRDGAALRDILKVLSKAVPVRLTLAHAAVQGETAPAEIAAALARLGALPGLEVVIVARGGGSADDLWAFNDERVARAIAEHLVPVISGVGHQVDVTIADLVADRRAATPTEAAALAVPERGAAARAVSDLVGRLARAARSDLRHRRVGLEATRRGLPDGARLLDRPRQKLDELGRSSETSLRASLRGHDTRRASLEGRLLRLHPESRLQRRRATLGLLRGRVAAGASASIANRRARLGQAAAALEAMSPLKVLSRGYALTRRPDGALVTDAGTVAVGDEVEVTLRRGRLDCRVRQSHAEDDPDLGE
jgi:exodeoxyribonuclease VII large subunit